MITNYTYCDASCTHSEEEPIIRQRATKLIVNDIVPSEEFEMPARSLHQTRPGETPDIEADHGRAMVRFF